MIANQRSTILDRWPTHLRQRPMVVLWCICLMNSSEETILEQRWFPDPYTYLKQQLTNEQSMYELRMTIRKSARPLYPICTMEALVASCDENDPLHLLVSLFMVDETFITDYLLVHFTHIDASYAQLQTVIHILGGTEKVRTTAAYHEAWSRLPFGRMAMQILCQNVMKHGLYAVDGVMSYETWVWTYIIPSVYTQCEFQYISASFSTMSRLAAHRGLGRATPAERAAATKSLFMEDDGRHYRRTLHELLIPSGLPDRSHGGFRVFLNELIDQTYREDHPDYNIKSFLMMLGMGDHPEQAAVLCGQLLDQARNLRTYGKDKLSVVMDRTFTMFDMDVIEANLYSLQEHYKQKAGSMETDATSVDCLACDGDHWETLERQIMLQPQYV